MSGTLICPITRKIWHILSQNLVCVSFVWCHNSTSIFRTIGLQLQILAYLANSKFWWWCSHCHNDKRLLILQCIVGMHIKAAKCVICYYVKFRAVSSNIGQNHLHVHVHALNTKSYQTIIFPQLISKFDQKCNYDTMERVQIMIKINLLATRKSYTLILDTVCMTNRQKT